MKKTVFLLMLFISTIIQAQTVPKQSRLAITQNVKQNNATRIVVQDSITKELNWVLKSNLNPTLDQVLGAGNTTGKNLTIGSITGNYFYPRTVQFPTSGGSITATGGGNRFLRLSLGGLFSDMPYYFDFTDVNLQPDNFMTGKIQGVEKFKITRDGKMVIADGVASNEAITVGQLNTAISGSTSYLSKFNGTYNLRNSSWRETSTGSRLFNATDDGFTTFQLTGSASISNTLKISSNYSTALTGTGTFGTGVQATSNGFADGLLAVSTNGVAGDFDIQSTINGNESNIAEFKDNGVLQASISDVGLATVNGLVSNDKITTTSSIKIGDDTSPANQYTAGTFRYRSLAEVGFPEVVTQDGFGNYNWRTLYHSGNLNLNNYLSIAGGTLTGALNGTSGTFSGTLVNTGVATTGAITATGTITSTGISTASAFQQSGTGFSFGNTNMQLNTGSRFLWSGDGVFTGAKDIGIARTGTAGSGVLNIMDGGTNANLRDLRLRTLFATGLNVTAGTAPASATATGTAGAIIITSTFIYYCTANNTWVRSALATW